MLNFDFSEKGLGLGGKWGKCFSCYTLLTDQILVSDCLFFSRYWSIGVLKLFVNQVVTSSILKLTLAF